MARSSVPKPYVRPQLTRRQAEAALQVLREAADARGQRHPLRRAVAILEQALARQEADHRALVALIAQRTARPDADSHRAEWRAWLESGTTVQLVKNGPVWCAVADGYQPQFPNVDGFPTRCGATVVNPQGFANSTPDCPDCLAADPTGSTATKETTPDA